MFGLKRTLRPIKCWILNLSDNTFLLFNKNFDWIEIKFFIRTSDLSKSNSIDEKKNENR